MSAPTACRHPPLRSSRPSAPLPVGSRLELRRLATLLALCACSDPSPAIGELIRHDAWRPLSPSDDPFAYERPDDAECDVLGRIVEDFEGEPSLSIDTRICEYVTLEQPSLAALSGGDELHLRIHHFDLSAEAPAEGHAAVVLAGQLAWETHVPIPSPDAMIDATFSSPTDVSRGDPIEFHLHNHGENNWSLIELSVVP